MSSEKPFFMRDPWVYDPVARPPQRADADLGFDTRALHAGFHPQQDLEAFRSFVPPIIQSMTFPYKSFDKIPCPVYGRTQTPTNSLLEKRLASLKGGEACITAGSGSQALFNLIFTIARPGDNVYSGLPDHPQHELAKQQMIDHGGLLSFIVSDGRPGAAKVMDALKLVVHAVTFGTSRTICMHPATITHEHMTSAERTAAGIDDGLIRLSVVLENPEDIIADLEQALSV